MPIPAIENYLYKYKSRGKWIFVPNEYCNRRAEHVLNFFRRNIEFPEYFYHYKPGGHVAALHEHLQNSFFFKVDVRNFFYSIARNRVHRALAAHGLKGAPTYAKWSTVRSPYPDGPRYVLPIGFWQSPHIASLVLMHSPVVEAIERARANGAFISVYLDDFIGSHNDETLLRSAYDEIRQSCVDANLLPNEDKLVPPSEAIQAFNCNVTKGSVVVAPERISKFFAKPRTDAAISAFNAYVDRVARANQTGAIA